jgi:transporter family-2 protein
MFMHYAFAFVIGCLVVVSPILNGRNAQRFGTLRGSFYNYFFAFIGALLLTSYFVTQPRFLTHPTSYDFLSNTPWTHYLGGFIGCLVILVMNYFTVRIKAFYIVILPFIGQMATGLLIDGLSGEVFTVKQFLGLGLMILGLLLSVMFPKKHVETSG